MAARPVGRASPLNASLMLASAWLLLRRVAAYAWLGYLFARTRVRGWLGLGIGGSASAHGPSAYRVYAFNESADPEGFYVEIPLSQFCMESWEDDVGRLTGWGSFRVEIRYAFRSKKYRMVLHPGDRCSFPPYAEPAAPAMRLPKGVLSARLLGPLGSDVECDVTSRVMKYQGPRGDFHAGLGLAVKLRDMFPFDDHEDNCHRFTHLRLMDTRGQLHDMRLSENPPMADHGAALKAR